MEKFRVEVIAKTENPQQVIYGAMHQDYSEDFVIDSRDSWPSETKSGKILVKRLLAGDRGHYGPLENASIVFNCGYFPHSVIQQIRTHRVGISFDVQSGRYTGDRILKFAEFALSYLDDNVVVANNLEKLFYLRPVGSYSDRHGNRYQYTETERRQHLENIYKAVMQFYIDVKNGISYEQARGIMPFDVRQHWVMSLNVRSLMHLLDMRWKKDAQLECQQLCELIWPHFQEWVPQIAEWYLQNRAKKARLSP